MNFLDSNVVGVFGLPGSGKSCLLAKIAKSAIKKGIKVYSNYYISGCYKLDFYDLGVHDYSDSLILIDEISLVADSRNWKNFSSDLVYFFTHVRHHGNTIIYCSQSFSDCDIKIRNITDSLYLVKSCLFGFSCVRSISKDFDIDNDISNCYKLTGFPYFFFRPFYYKFFDSYYRKPLPPNCAPPWDAPKTPLSPSPDAPKTPLSPSPDAPKTPLSPSPDAPKTPLDFERDNFFICLK